MVATLDQPDTAPWLDLIFDWDPEKRPIHCSNCRHCVARPPRATCEKGHGPEYLSYLSLLRENYPSGFAQAAKCEDFDSMSDRQMLANTPAPRKRGRKRLAAHTTTDSLTAHVDPSLVHEIDLWAKRIGVSRSELARWGWPKILELIKRRGRNKIRREIDERRDASRPKEKKRRG
ncbi:MAG: hypothetical protein M1343_13890 [Chloroflexi bacterium]|nr:hypothetical protein [Chloroflexota bacterium]MDA8189299.1 hypothetical protein [Dehalococcoidales bacterium]